MAETNVAPHVGAWIETSTPPLVASALSSRTSRRCVD